MAECKTCGDDFMPIRDWGTSICGECLAARVALNLMRLGEQMEPSSNYGCSCRARSSRESPCDELSATWKWISKSSI